MTPWIEEVGVQYDDGSTAGDSQVLVLPPDPATTVVWRMTAAGDSDVLVTGPRTKASYQAKKKLPALVRLRIQPGRVRSLLGVGGDELVDRVVPLTELWGSAATSLAAELTEHRDDPDRAVDLLARQLAAKAPDRQGRSGRSELVLAAIEELSAGARVAQAAGRAGVSERYLRRVFIEAVGLSPKHFARINRVRSVLGRAGSWSRIATEAGYFDQSHLVAEFRSIMRVTPAAFAAGRVPVTTC
ncbi:AraC-like DNA-binding protein [Kribbella voronezhensis]|uniref:AraC-like DNA-binding protein n=1 Tax=Kribbella voronezhensis TaxID=2512212 RepID=A0A4R7TH52_9ACTN|nr:AraC family transcriptional regulator [Kribbella voronezhensis]TDU91600.1 AraC-like DNA-binding protein [Kribbella voronezhensis]